MDLKETKEYAEIFVKSGLFKDVSDVAKAVVKILAGKELGVPPFSAMNGIDIIKGRVSVKPVLMAGLIKRSGKLDYKIKQLDQSGCWIEFFRKVDSDGSWELLGTSSFTREDARQAGLLVGENYQKYPTDMFFNRAMGRGFRMFCAELFLGPVYVEEELPQEIPGEGYEEDSIPVLPPQGISLPEPTDLAEVPTSPEPPIEEAPTEPKKDPTPTEDAPKPTTTELLSTEDIGKLVAIGRTKGWKIDGIHSLIKEKFGKESLKELTKEEMRILINSELKSRVLAIKYNTKKDRSTWQPSGRQNENIPFSILKGDEIPIE